MASAANMGKSVPQVDLFQSYEEITEETTKVTIDPNVKQTEAKGESCITKAREGCSALAGKVKNGLWGNGWKKALTITVLATLLIGIAVYLLHQQGLLKPGWQSFTNFMQQNVPAWGIAAGVGAGALVGGGTTYLALRKKEKKQEDTGLLLDENKDVKPKGLLARLAGLNPLNCIKSRVSDEQTADTQPIERE